MLPAWTIVLLLVLAACKDPTPTPTPTPTATPTPVPGYTPGPLPAIPSLGVEDRFGTNIERVTDLLREFSVFATVEDLSHVSSVTVNFPDGSQGALTADSETWGFQWLGPLPIGTYVFDITLTDSTTFQKLHLYDGQRP